ncbi:MAG: ferrochelatase [Acidimicrobiales bacterium]
MADALRGVVVMSYGTPATPDAIAAYYTHVRRGRRPTPELLADLERRYEAIGGLSPLATRTRAQAAALAAELGDGWVTVLGNKHAEPFLEDGVREIARTGARLVVGLVLAPHTAALSTGEYHARAREVAVPSGMAYRLVGSWGDHPALVDLLATRVRAALARYPAGARVMTLFTAHSLPERALGYDRPSYPDQLAATAAAVAGRAGLDRWQVAWQSAGRTDDPWIGPDIGEVIAGLPAQGFDGVLVCPAGFVSDHLEVLYDVDIEARQQAGNAGLVLERTDSLNDDPGFVALLADLVRQAADP